MELLSNILWKKFEEENVISVLYLKERTIVRVSRYDGVLFDPRRKMKNTY